MGFSSSTPHGPCQGGSLSDRDFGCSLAAVNRLVLALCITALGGCAGGAVPPLYTQEEQRAQCERGGGWWHPDDLTGGFCESNSQM